MRSPAVAIAVVGGLLAGCTPTSTEIEPPVVHFGQDICTACSMIISEERFAGAIGLRRNGRITHQLFDDVGEMLGFEPGEHEAIRWFARDASTREWIDAEAATFLLSEELMTPMGSGVGAYATRELALAAQDAYGGEVHGFPAMRRLQTDE